MVTFGAVSCAVGADVSDNCFVECYSIWLSGAVGGALLLAVDLELQPLTNRSLIFSFKPGPY